MNQSEQAPLQVALTAFEQDDNNLILACDVMDRYCEAKRFVDAIDFFNCYRERFAQQAAFLLRASNAYIATKDYTHALEHLQQLEIFNLDSFAVDFNLAYCYFFTSQLDKAVQFVEKALGQGECYGPALLLAAQIHYQRQALDVAITHLEQYLSVSPGDSNAHGLHAIMLLDREQPQDLAQAERIASAVLLEVPQQTNALLVMAALNTRGQNATEAKRLLLAVLSQDAQCLRAHFNLAQLYMQENDPALAAEHYEKVLVLQPDNVTAWYELAWAKLLNKQGLEALDAVEALLSLDKQHADGMAMMALIHLGEGHHTKAEAWLNQAREINANSFTLALCEAFVANKANDAASVRSCIDKAFATGHSVNIEAIVSQLFNPKARLSNEVTNA